MDEGIMARSRSQHRPSPNAQWNTAGFSLVSILVSIGLLGLISLGIANMVDNLNREVKATGEKLSALELERNSLLVLGDGSICNFMVTTNGPWLRPGTQFPLKINPSSTNHPPISFTKLLTTPKATAPPLIEVDSPATLNSKTLIVKSIEITNIKGEPTDNQFPATLQVTWDTNKSVRPLMPISHQVILLTSGTGADKTITGCVTSSPGSNEDWQCGIRGGTTHTCVHTTDGNVCTYETGLHQTCYGCSGARWNCGGTTWSQPYGPDGDIRVNSNGWPANGSWRCNIQGVQSYTAAVNNPPLTCVNVKDGNVCYYGSAPGCYGCSGTQWTCGGSTWSQPYGPDGDIRVNPNGWPQ